MLDARRIGFDGLSPFFEGMLRQALPEAEFVGVEDMMRGLRRVKLPGRDHLPPHRGRDRGVRRCTRRSPRSGPASPSTTSAPRSSTACAQLGTSQFAQQGTFTVHRSRCARSGGRPATASSAKGDAVALAGGVLWAGYEGSLARTWWCGDDTLPAAGQRGRRSRAGGAVTDAVIEQCRPGRTGADLRAAFEGAGGARPADDDRVRRRPRLRGARSRGRA